MSGNGTPTSPTDDATVGALRRVKTTEAEWEQRLRAAREEAERAIARARDEADATIKAVAAEVETERAHRLEQGRAAADREAEAIRLEGAKTADSVRGEKGKRAADREGEIVHAVLDPFASD